MIPTYTLEQILELIDRNDIDQLTDRCNVNISFDKSAFISTGTLFIKINGKQEHYNLFNYCDVDKLKEDTKEYIRSKKINKIINVSNKINI